MPGELKQIIDSLSQSTLGLLALHGGGLIACSMITAAVEVILQEFMGKKHPKWLLLIYAIIVGIVYRAYITRWVYEINLVSSLSVLVVGTGYGILAVGSYFRILKPLYGTAIKFLKSKLKIRG